jgi:hypothetical protein
VQSALLVYSVAPGMGRQTMGMNQLNAVGPKTQWQALTLGYYSTCVQEVGPQKRTNLV